jgi:hypothetical protein
MQVIRLVLLLFSLTAFLWSSDNDVFSQGFRSFSSLVSGFARGVSARRFFHHIPYSVKKEFLSSLRPGDILLERTEGNFTNVFISGYFNHCSIYLGTKSEIKKYLNPASHLESSLLSKLPEDVPFVLEAVPPVVRCGRYFLQKTTHLLALRVTGKYDYKELILKGLQFVGTPYDFSYSEGDDERVTCVGLIHSLYPALRLKSHGISGSIVPDSILFEVAKQLKVISFASRRNLYSGKKAHETLIRREILSANNFD